MGVVQSLADLFSFAAEDEKRKEALNPTNPAQPARPMEPLQIQPQPAPNSAATNAGGANLTVNTPPQSDPGQNQPQSPVPTPTQQQQQRPPMVSRIFREGSTLDGCKVLIRDAVRKQHIVGFVADVDEKIGAFSVVWSDDRITTEALSDYEVINVDDVVKEKDATPAR